MAKPRVFISSTFYDLRQVREDIERMILDLGYDPVRNETGAIPYSKRESPEDSAYREIERCDILVSIIGGRFGTPSRDKSGYSISQNELRRALERGVQVFIFIEKSVQSEYEVFRRNKHIKEVQYAVADAVEIFEFIEQIYSLPMNNAVFYFETASEIASHLKLQWAGLFQRFLQEQTRLEELHVLSDLNATAKTLKEVVDFLTEERKNRDNDAINTILRINHPIFRRLAELTQTEYRVFFTNRNEMEKWLNVRGWVFVFDPWEMDDGSSEEWINKKLNAVIKFKTLVFDANNKLILYSKEDWDDNWIQYAQLASPTQTEEEDDIPF